MGLEVYIFKRRLETATVESARERTVSRSRIVVLRALSSSQL